MAGVQGDGTSDTEGGGVMDVVRLKGREYNVEVYDQTETAFEMTLGYARIEGVVWVCRLEGDGAWKAIGRKGA